MVNNNLPIKLQNDCYAYVILRDGKKYLLYSKHDYEDN